MIIIICVQKSFISPDDLENIWNRVEKEERFKKIQPLVMTCVVNSEKFSEYEFTQPKLLSW